MIEIIKAPWPWYTSGFLIALILVMLLFMGKSFGFSANLRTICTMCGADKVNSFFRFDWKSQFWNLLFLFGAILGGFISERFLSHPGAVPKIADATIADLAALGFSAPSSAQPAELFDLAAFKSIKTMFILLFGGLLVGFGARYAGGCTSGHAISGLSNLQLPSLIAVAGFFIGGLLMTYFVLPIIF